MILQHKNFISACFIVVLSVLDVHSEVEAIIEFLVPEEIEQSFKDAPKLAAELAQTEGGHVLVVKNISEEIVVISKHFNGSDFKYINNRGGVIEEGGVVNLVEVINSDHVVLAPGKSHSYEISLKKIEGEVAGYRYQLHFGVLIPSYKKYHPFSMRFESEEMNPRANQ